MKSHGWIAFSILAFGLGTYLAPSLTPKPAEAAPPGSSSAAGASLVAVQAGDFVCAATAESLAMFQVQTSGALKLIDADPLPGEWMVATDRLSVVQAIFGKDE